MQAGSRQMADQACNSSVNRSDDTRDRAGRDHDARDKEKAEREQSPPATALQGPIPAELKFKIVRR
jgi:hypothetical protein